MHMRFPWAFDGHSFRKDLTLAWEGESFSEVSSLAGVADDSRLLVLPGLVNLHAHLELTSLAGLLPRMVPFPQWVQALRAHTSSWSQATWRESLQAGIEQSLAAGTTTVLDVGNSLAGWHLGGNPRLRLHSMHELIGLDPAVAKRRFDAALQALTLEGAEGVVRGLSAHAPYSCAPDLLQHIAQWCDEHRQPFTMHLAESAAEAELYASAGGAFRAWLDDLVPQHPFRDPVQSGLAYVRGNGMPARSIVVHGNCLSRAELAMLQRAECALVHCPQSARWFGHPRLDVQACRELGVGLCLGSDSLASAESLSLWAQLQVFHETWPQVPCAEVLAMVTSVLGQALQADGRLGALRPGALADFVAVRLPEGFDGNGWDWLLSGEPRVEMVFVNGKRVR